MKKILMVALCLVIVPMLFAGPTKDAAIVKQAYDLDARDARLASPPTRPVQIDDGRALGDLLMTIDLAAIGVPGGGFSGAGLTWDGTYLYYENQNDHMIYVIDPTGPSVVTSWSAGLPHAWGVGSEVNMWVDDALGSPGMTYEYAWGGTPTGNSFNAMSGGASWMGDISEWYTSGEIAILAVGGTNEIYTFTVPGGAPIGSIGDPAWTSISQRALTYDPVNHTFWLGGWNVGTIWEVDANTGAVLRQFNPADYAIAGLAYDWQSTLHPTPVLWLATNSAPDYIYMLDADNPQPGGDILYVDDDDDATLSGYFETSFSNLGMVYDIWVVTDSGDVTPDASVMGNYDIVVWTTGDDYSSTFVGNDTIEVANYLAGGGKMWLSSEDILYDLGPVSWLHVASYDSDIGCAAATGIGPIMTGTSFATTGGVVWDYSDEINPDAFAWTEMQNETPVDNTIAMDPSTGLSYFLFFNAFAFENIDAEADRDTMMQRVISWLSQPPPDHDVGTTAIIEPPTTIMPNTTINPSATYQNFGGSSETFDVFFSIDSLGTPLYLETVNVTVPAGGNTTHVYTNTWTSGPSDGIVYDITAWTVLSGDTDPSNDTLTATTTTQSAFWKIYTSNLPQASYYNACVYAVSTGAATVYSLGGDPTYTAIFEFDIPTETWSTPSATLNHEARRLAAAVVDGKIYAIGGMPGATTTALDYCQEYDPVAGTVTDKTAMPTARQFLGAVAWNDTLIYVMGGQSASSYYSTIEIYDPANDAWTTATSLPEANRSFACGIAGDIIYVTGGYSGSGYLTATHIGVIDPTNPQSITWSSGPDIPLGSSGIPGRSRVQGACVETDSGWMFYFTCGDDHGVAAYDTWFYDPNDALWHQTLDKPTPISNSQCAVWVPSIDEGTFFCAGGYNTATASATNATEGLVNLGPTGIQEAPVDHRLSDFGFAAMANPVTHNAGIAYTITVPGRVSLKVYDRSGRLVETLVNSVQQAGTQIANWNVENIANGVYFIRLVVQGETATHKMILVK